MRVGIFLGSAVIAALSFSAMMAWPSWWTALVCLGAIVLCFSVGVRPKPFWWFPAATLLLVAAITFLFNQLLASPRTGISPLGYVAGAVLSLMVEYRGRQSP